MHIRQFLVYVGVGLVTTGIDIGTMQTLLWLGWTTTLAVSVAFALGLVFNYATHQRVTFKAYHSASTMLRFSILVAVNYGLTLLCVHTGERWFDSALVGKLLSLPLVTINGFLCGRYWIFRRRQ